MVSFNSFQYDTRFICMTVHQNIKQKQWSFTGNKLRSLKLRLCVNLKAVLKTSAVSSVEFFDTPAHIRLHT